MCGIVGIVSQRNIVNALVSGLKRLEYRGYDSAGIAVAEEGSAHITRVRAEGKLAALEAAVADEKPQGCTGIGHTRWATHGAPTLVNAHPHISENIAVVHNGIIENFLALRQELEAEGAVFVTDTDTEVIPHLLLTYVRAGMHLKEAMQQTISRLEGAFAIAAIVSGHEDILLAARKGSPLAIGYGKGEMYLASDALALAPFTRTITYLEEGDIALLTIDSVEIFDQNGATQQRAKKEVATEDVLVAKEHFDHYMLKEIYEQPTVIGSALKSYYHALEGKVYLPELPFDLATLEEINIVACGTSYYAGMVAEYWLEQMAQVPVNVDIASEFRYRQPVLKQGGLTLLISQSGETADTLAAMRYAKAHGQHTLAFVNVKTSTMAREADAMLELHAGPEIGVASTKAFTAQLMALACFTLATAAKRQTIAVEQEAALTASLSAMSSRMLHVLQHDEAIRALCKQLNHVSNVIYIGRGLSYPLALEGALKLKEITYLPSEATAAGELKHGPIALIDDKTPVIALAPSDALFEKTVGNVNEVAARGGKIVLLSDKRGIERLGNIAWKTIELPEVDPFAAPILYAIPIQLIAYHMAVAKGTDVDMPRNLAKSVTVE